MTMSPKISHDSGWYFNEFWKIHTHVVPQPFKVSQHGLNWFSIYDKGKLSLSGYLMSEKPRLFRVNERFQLCNGNKMVGNLEVYFKSDQFTMTTVTFFVTLEG